MNRRPSIRHKSLAKVIREDPEVRAIADEILQVIESAGRQQRPDLDPIGDALRKRFDAAIKKHIRFGTSRLRAVPKPRQFDHYHGARP